MTAFQLIPFSPFFLHLLFRLTCDVYLNYLHAMWSLFFSLYAVVICKHLHASMWSLIASVRSEMEKVPKMYFFPPHSHDSFFYDWAYNWCTKQHQLLLLPSHSRSFQNQHTKVFVKYLPSKNIIIIKMKDRNNERMRMKENKME